MVTKAKEYLYTDLITIQTSVEEVNKDTGQLVTRKTNYGEFPGRVSYKTLQPVNDSTGAGRIVQSITLFISNKVKIPQNSVIIVKRYGKDEMHFKCSGAPNIYSDHQEIALIKLEEYIHEV